MAISVVLLPLCNDKASGHSNFGIREWSFATLIESSLGSHRQGARSLALSSLDAKTLPEHLQVSARAQ
jgi:hypothetical protein